MSYPSPSLRTTRCLKLHHLYMSDGPIAPPGSLACKLTKFGGDKFIRGGGEGSVAQVRALVKGKKQACGVLCGSMPL
jgi:hypothetical protein